MAHSRTMSVPDLISSVYADANAKLGPEWYEYGIRDDRLRRVLGARMWKSIWPFHGGEFIARRAGEFQLTTSFRNQDNYEVINRVGRGKYSEVFAGVELADPTRPYLVKRQVVIKVLKPIKKKKVKRELKVLNNLKGGPNIIELYDVVREPIAKIPALVFEFVQNIDSRTLYREFTNYDIRFYIYQLLKALDFCHSRGIIHRDVKPLNILIDHKQRKLRLIDWGLAEFYHPGVELNVRVASRYYKAPELLVDFTYYDYSMDLWSVGCTMATMVYQLDPFFQGADNYDQLVKITNVLGTADLFAYVEKYRLTLSTEYDSRIRETDRVPWHRLVSSLNRSTATPDALEFLDHLLRYDHRERLTAKEAMCHPYLDVVRDEEIQAHMF